MRTVLSSRAFIGVLCALLALAAAGDVYGQIHYTQPPPGSVYREYTRTMDGLSDWRVTDPNIDLNRWPAADPFVPNPELPLDVSDLSGATRAEATFTIWGGHIGTIGKQVRFNGNDWIDLPPLAGINGIPAGHDGENYMYQSCVTVDVPLSDLHVGTNIFEGTNAGQNEAHTFGWGQHGWYGIVLRIYYSPAAKSHPSGSITFPVNGGTLGLNPTIQVSASAPGGVERVDVLAYYDGYDTDGDGVYQEYHGDYHPSPASSEMEIRNHVGTAFSSPYGVTWSTSWVPDQAQGSVKLVAHIKGNDGVWFATNEVSNLSLSRNGSVVLYKPQGVPEQYWVKEFITNNSNTFTIPAGHPLSSAMDARFLIRSWNGINGAAEPPNDAYAIQVNDWHAPAFGANHAYQFDVLSFSPTELHTGTNTTSAFCNSVHHGIELLWPGPAVMVQYDVATPIQLSRFSAVQADGGEVRLSWTTVSETRNYGFDVQRSAQAATGFVTIPNSFVAGHGTSADEHAYAFTTGPDPVAVYYRLKQMDLDGTVTYTDAIRVDVVSGVAERPLPTSFVLEQNFPNPFNPTTLIRFALPRSGFVHLQVVNALGEVVKTLVSEERSAGEHVVRLDASGLGSGVYFYRLEAGGFVSVRKMTLLR